MSRISPSTAVIGAALVLFASLGVGPAADARTPTPTPTRTRTPTATSSPTSGPPGPLTMATLTDDLLTWPNLPVSSKPFEIDIRFCEQAFHYEVPGDATSFRLPPEAMAAINCCGTRSIEVSSTVLCSQAVVMFPSPLCLPPATSTPAIQMPPTGYGDGSGSSGVSQTMPVALGALLLVVGGWYARRRWLT